MRQVEHSNLRKMELKTNEDNRPMNNWSRVIIETDEANPQVLAIVTNEDYELAKGLRIRLRPIPKELVFKRLP
ncbi:hypothetical protein RON44_00245 [Lactobacillus gasseri]|uniref:hypothetical protein n=1 Tax=Lactobacillus gasseri TaxID=1596 RepID=UPI000E44B140|nr:hypothetical protein [Lactobacillus gasseri]MCZ3944385.1 hypothetical protein [Lactobacillus gasseri]MCZ3947113.1 hypothetical protein [Lactobacillus gasseri]MCZ3980973.1 hypothetical protein [Lactobacillus gasseri]MCZ3995133.1 hypothetical protein [Lactobacillus gasseri]MCZ4003351.1 hypothetical protein [Lactobacillus gasseri]